MQMRGAMSRIVSRDVAADKTAPRRASAGRGASI